MKVLPSPVAGKTDWLKYACVRVEPDVVPPGFQSVDQIAKLVGCSASHVHKGLRKSARKGLLERAQFRIQGANKIIKVWFYREIRK